MAFDLSWLWSTLTNVGSAITSWAGSIWTGVIKPIENVGQGILAGLIALGSAIWDVITRIVSGVIGVVQAIWSVIVRWFQGLASAITSWWSGVINAINTWFTNLLKFVRRKIRETIIVDIAIANTWKAGERILHAQGFKDIALGGLGLVASPLIGYLVGAIVDSLVPTPSTTTYPLIPDIVGFTPPIQDITLPTQVTVPSGTSYGVFTGVEEKPSTINLDNSATTESQDKLTPISLSYESIPSTDKETEISLSYETEIA